MAWDEGLHPRHPAGTSRGGEFAPKSGGSMPRALLDKLLQPDGGFSYQPVTGDEPRDGFMVSIFPEASWATDAKSLSFMDLARYYASNAKLLSDRSNYLGAWHDPETGRVFLDVSRRVTSSVEASRLCEAHDQIAYFDLANGRSVTVNRNAKSGGAA